MTRARQTSSDRARLDQAVSWHVRLHSGEAGESEWQDFTAWLEADPENRRALERVEDLSEELDAARDEIRAGLRQLEAAKAADNVVVLTVRRWARQAATAPRGLAAAALVAASLVIAIGLGQLWPGAPASQMYATRIGEQRLVTLADGSAIRLNTDTEITVALADDVRHVTLDHGEALFRVAKDPSRPFIVAVGEQNVRVVGTVFNILKHQGRVTVTVAEGIVAVHPADARRPSSAELAATLTAGRQLIHEEGSGQIEIRDVDPGTVLAWQDGNLTYENTPLSEVVRDLNRYFPIPVEPQNAGVAALQFSGVLKIDNEDAVLHRLEEFLPVTADRTDHKIILRPRAVAR